MESISAYQDILSRSPEDRDIDWLILAARQGRTWKRDFEVLLTLHHWEEESSRSDQDLPMT